MPTFHIKIYATLFGLLALTWHLHHHKHCTCCEQISTNHTQLDRMRDDCFYEIQNTQIAICDPPF